jgi:hypothetical protein
MACCCTQLHCYIELQTGRQEFCYWPTAYYAPLLWVYHFFLEKGITLLLESNSCLQYSWGCQLEQSVKGWQAKDPTTTKLNFRDVIMSLSCNLQAGSSAYWGYDSRHMIDKCLWLTDHLPDIRKLLLYDLFLLPSLHLEESDALPPPVFLLLNSV